MKPPIVLALVPAERVVRHRRDGRFDLHCVFHALNLKLPTRLTFAAYYSLTEVHEPCDVRISFRGPDETELGGGQVRLPIDDPAAVVASMVQFDVAITGPGTYRLQIECGGELLAERPVIIGAPVSS